MTEFLKTIFLLVTLLVVVKTSSNTDNIITDDDQEADPFANDPGCLQCICVASSHCNANMGCSTPFFGGYRCGPLSISWHYWADAGRPVINNDPQDTQEGFENCVNDLYCATETMKRYMIRFARFPNGDFDGNGVINCEDYIRIHMMGGYNCNQPQGENLIRYKRFRECYKSQNETEEVLIARK